MPSSSPASAVLASPDIAIITGFEAIASRYDLVFCDVWGVLHDGITAFPAAADALQRFRAGGGCVVLVSNAPRPNQVVAKHLDLFGVKRDAFDAIVTSGDVTRDMVVARGARRVFHLGPDRDASVFRDTDIELVDIDEAELVVCTGLVDDETETVDTYRATLEAMRRRGLLMISANPDLVVERGDRLILCAGSLAAAYEAMGGESIAGGKPHRPIYETALNVGERLLGRSIGRERILGIGDAIRTDIAGARGFGIDGLLIARGIHAGDLGIGIAGFDAAIGLAWLSEQSHRPTAMAAALEWR